MKVLNPTPDNAEFISDVEDNRCPACNKSFSMSYSERVRCDCGLLIEMWGNSLAVWRDRPLKLSHRLRLFFKSDRFRAYLEGYSSAFNFSPVSPKFPDKSLELEEELRSVMHRELKKVSNNESSNIRND